MAGRLSPGILATALLFAIWAISPGSDGDAAERSRARCGKRQGVHSDGWCRVCRSGWVAGIRVASREVFHALDPFGHALAIGPLACRSCQEARRRSGFCENHHAGFARNRVFATRLSHRLATGVRIDPGRVSCAACRRNADSSGWCGRHSAGFVGAVRFGERREFDEAVAARKLLSAAETELLRCSRCATAILWETACPICRLDWKGGERTGLCPDPDVAPPSH